MTIYTLEQREEMKRLRLNGMGAKKIAKLFGCAPSTVLYHTNDNSHESNRLRKRKWRANNPIQNKLRCYRTRRGLHAKTRDFKRRKGGILGVRDPECAFTVTDVINKLGDCPKCYLTGRSIDLDSVDTYNFDHVIPASRGGENSLENLQILCREVNMVKSDRTVPELLAMCEEILRHHGYAVVSPKMEEGNAAAAYPTEESPRFECGVKTA